MAHIAKYNSGSAGKMLNHYLRGREKSSTKSSIDPERTPLNRSWCPNGNPRKYYEKRKSEIGVKRKDAITMCDVVLTLPKEFVDKPQDEIGLFFSDASQFFAERYGEENIIGGFLHMDETTPHIHLAFTPVMDGRFCAKKLINRQELRSLHPDLGAYLTEKLKKNLPNWDFDTSKILNGGTLGYETVEAIKKAASLKTEVKVLEERVETLKERSEALEGKNKALEETFEKNQAIIKVSEAKIVDLSVVLDEKDKQVKEIDKLWSALKILLPDAILDKARDLLDRVKDVLHVKNTAQGDAVGMEKESGLPEIGKSFEGRSIAQEGFGGRGDRDR